MPDFRLRNIEKEIGNWLEVFDWELLYLRFYHEDEELIMEWEINMPNDWADQV